MTAPQPGVGSPIIPLPNLRPAQVIEGPGLTSDPMMSRLAQLLQAQKQSQGEQKIQQQNADTAQQQAQTLEQYRQQETDRIAQQNDANRRARDLRDPFVAGQPPELQGVWKDHFNALDAGVSPETIGKVTQERITKIAGAPSQETLDAIHKYDPSLDALPPEDRVKQYVHLIGLGAEASHSIGPEGLRQVQQKLDRSRIVAERLKLTKDSTLPVLTGYINNVDTAVKEARKLPQYITAPRDSIVSGIFGADGLQAYNDAQTRRKQLVEGAAGGTPPAAVPQPSGATVTPKSPRATTAVIPPAPTATPAQGANPLADLWERLTKQGMSPDSATAAVNAYSQRQR